MARQRDRGMDKAENNKAHQGRMRDQARTQTLDQMRVYQRRDGNPARHQRKDGGKQVGGLEHVKKDLL